MKVKDNWFFRRNFLPFAPEHFCEWSDEKEEYVYYTTTCAVAVSVIARLLFVPILLAVLLCAVVLPITATVAYFGWNPFSLTSDLIQVGTSFMISYGIFVTLILLIIAIHKARMVIKNRMSANPSAVSHYLDAIATSVSDRLNKICRRIDFEE